MNLSEIKSFQESQKEIVAMIGSFITVLKSYSHSLSSTSEDTEESRLYRSLQPLVSEFSVKANFFSDFCTKYHYPIYCKEIVRATSRITMLLGYQTLPSQKKAISKFVAELDLNIEKLSEVMIATAQIVTPSIDTNIRADNSFSAYCIFSSIFDTTSSLLLLVDPYIDSNIFYRYLYRLPKQTNIVIVTDKKNLTGQKLNAFESVEVLFETEYPNYQRKMATKLHDRYLVNDTSAYSLGGSIKDAGKRSDYSIVQLSDAKRNELLQDYT